MVSDPVTFMLNAMSGRASVTDALAEMSEQQRALVWQAMRADGWTDSRAIEAIPCWRLWAAIDDALDLMRFEDEARRRPGGLNERGVCRVLEMLDAARDQRDKYREAFREAARLAIENMPPGVARATCHTSGCAAVGGIFPGECSCGASS